MLRAIALSSVGLALLAVSCGGSGDRQANEELLASLPQPPGTELTGVATHAYYDCGKGIFRQTLGHSTRATYRAPIELTPQEVVDFYISSLSPDWHLRRQQPIGVAVPVISGEPTPLRTREDLPSNPGGVPTLYFEQGTATVYVDPLPIPGPYDSPTPSPGLGAYNFNTTVDAEGTDERPYCD